MTLVEIISISLSAIAIVVSTVSIYLQYMVEGPKIELINTKDIQRRIARHHKELPEHIQKKYPHIPDTMPGYAVAKLVFGNSGDRTGLVSIKDLQVRIKDNDDRTINNIKASFSNYILLSAYEIVEEEILLKNVLLSGYTELQLEIKLTAEYGGYHPRTGKALRTKTIQTTLQVLIVRGDEDPDWHGFSYS